MPQQKPRHLPIAKPNFEQCYQNWLLEKIAQMNFMTTTNFTAFANAQVFHPWLCIQWKELPSVFIILVWKYQGCLEGNDIVTIVWEKKNESFDTVSC